MQHPLYYFAQAYGEGNYNEGVYSCTTQQEQNGECSVGAGSGSNGSANGGNLADTGLLIVAIATLACLIVFVSLIVRLWRRPKTAPATVASDSADNHLVS